MLDLYDAYIMLTNMLRIIGSGACMHVNSGACKFVIIKRILGSSCKCYFRYFSVEILSSWVLSSLSRMSFLFGAIS